MLKLPNQSCAALDHNYRCLNKEPSDQRWRGSRLEHQFRRTWVQHSRVISKVSINLFPHLLMIRWKQTTSKAPLAIDVDTLKPPVANLVSRMHTCAAWSWRKHTQIIPEALSTSFSAMVQGPSVQFSQSLSHVQFFATPWAMAPHPTTPAWKIPWTEEPGRLQSMGSLRVRHDWATSLSLFTFMHWRRKWQPTPVFFPRESQGQGSLVGCRLWGHTELDTTEAT